MKKICLRKRRKKNWKVFIGRSQDRSRIETFSRLRQIPLQERRSFEEFVQNSRAEVWALLQDSSEPLFKRSARHRLSPNPSFPTLVFVFFVFLTPDSSPLTLYGNLSPQSSSLSLCFPLHSILLTAYSLRSVAPFLMWWPMEKRDCVLVNPFQEAVFSRILWPARRRVQAAIHQSHHDVAPQSGRQQEDPLE